MAYNILLTSLSMPSDAEQIRYYYGKDGFKNMYCDAMLTVEASCKYVLSKYPVDEIITLGRKLTFDEGDDGKLIQLREGKNFYTADIKELSAYSLFRYRIAQYIDELHIEQQDLGLLLNEEAQKQVTGFVRRFYKERGFQDDDVKYNRFFDVLTKDPKMYETFKKELAKEVPGAADDMIVYKQWLKNYLYGTLKDSYKLEILPENSDVKVRFIPTSVSDDGKLPIENIMQLAKAIEGDHNDEINLYVALNSDDMTDNFVLISILDIINTFPDSRVHLRHVFTTSDSHNMLAGEIRDDTRGYGVTALNAAFRTFLKYGKADMIIDYWEKYGSENTRVDQMIYAMRHIDAGVSLCDIGEIENGISQLREILDKGLETEENDYYSSLFSILAEGIKRDYGELLTKDEVSFIDMARWAYRKSFYQQVLTLIESRAPEIFVNKGILYYCNSEEEKGNVAAQFARCRNSLRPNQYWMIDDNVQHYYIKTYLRGDNPIHTYKDAQRNYAALHVSLLDNTSNVKITGYTVCDDREALENLLFAYYHLCEIRNMTNHASMRESDDRLIVEFRDLSIRMMRIREGIDYFMQCYDKVIDLIKDKPLNVVLISPGEIKAKAKQLKD
ncbi:MAG: hypothetical protein IJH14_06885 [Solobacterium sp.]|nr:hypothetical protein [Solobacterium sp.]